MKTTLLLVFAALPLVSCRTLTSPAAQVTGPRSEHWVKVSSHPPTYYPRGVAADVETDVRSGEWVYTEDEQGTLFFIPFKGHGTVPRDVLRREALSAWSRKKVARLEREQAIAIVKTVLLTPVLMIGMAGGAGPSALP